VKLASVSESRKDRRMKIRDVKTYRLEAALVEPFAYSQAWYERRGAALGVFLGRGAFGQFPDGELIALDNGVSKRK
jgi:hypothetical protein